MNCPGCKTTVPMLIATALGDRCVKCAATAGPAVAPKAKRGRPPGSTTHHHNTAEDPPAFAQRPHRPAERLPVLQKIEKRIQGEIDWILRRDPDLRGLKFEAAVHAYRKTLQIVRAP